jgi:hypothetical protein
MNMPSVVAATESSKDLQALAAGLAELEEPWFAEPAAAAERRSTVPPKSGVVVVGEFLGDPLADAWLR